MEDTRETLAVKDDDLSDLIAATLNRYRWHFSSSAMCDEIHGILFLALKSKLAADAATLHQANEANRLEYERHCVTSELLRAAQERIKELEEQIEAGWTDQ